MQILEENVKVNDTQDKKDIIIINEETIRNKIYMIRGQKVMLDLFELRSDLNEVEDQMAKVMDRLSNVVTRSELAEISRQLYRSKDLGVIEGMQGRCDGYYF